MHTDDAVELAKNIKTVGYNEWTDVVDGLLYTTCSECGDSHLLMVKQTGPDMCRVRLVREPELTDATRENDVMELPLYREVIRLREENAQLRELGRVELQSVIRQMREVAAPVGPLHSWWDPITDMEAFLAGKPTLLQMTLMQWIQYGQELLRKRNGSTPA